jgi:hypothetical protein
MTRIMRRLLGTIAATLLLAGCGSASTGGPGPSAPTAPGTTQQGDWKTYDRAGYVVRVPGRYIDDMTTVRSLASTQRVPATLIAALRRQSAGVRLVDTLALADTDRSYGNGVPTLLTVDVVDHGRALTVSQLEGYDLATYRLPATRGYFRLLGHRHVRLPAGTAIEWNLEAPWSGRLQYAAVQYSFAHGRYEYAITVHAPAARLAWARAETHAVAATLKLR